MPKIITPKEIYERLATEGLYLEANCDKNEIKKVVSMTEEDYTFGKKLRKMQKPSWRVIFNINYDVFRELCDQLMRFKEQKTSNHQGVFAFIVLNFKDLALDWNFLEEIRTTRNKNKYQGLNISKEMWKRAELQFDLYISAVKKEIEKKLKK